VLEQALESCPDERVASVWADDMRKMPLLQRDLRYFEPRAVADLKEAVEAALNTAERLRLSAREQPLALLGWLYVLEGSTLGAQGLRSSYARAFLLTGEDGLAYLNPYGKTVHTRWAQYQQRMNTLGLKAEERGPVVEAANEMFLWLESIFRRLFPFSPESRTFLVTSINPEAGRHPVPADPREVQASLRAADACWERFPYFEQRYGERGRRFARSDAAWLATLCPYEPARIIQQVAWLSRVLAGRGMPTLLLQVQLEILVAQLAGAIPGKKSEYDKLLLASAELQGARRRHLTDAQADALTAAFHQSVGPGWSKQFPHAGALLVCAVADEMAGAHGAVDNLRHWMTDANRFPTEWIAAVEKTLVQARAQACPTPARDGHQ